MKLAILAAALLFQGVQPPHLTDPTLSTAERTALNALEQQKKAAQDSYVQAQQAEATIEHEFGMAHPGFRVNPQTLAVEKDQAPEAKKTEGTHAP